MKPNKVSTPRNCMEDKSTVAKNDTRCSAFLEIKDLKIYVRSLSLDYGRRGTKKDIQKKYGHLTAHLCSNSDLFSLP